MPAQIGGRSAASWTVRSPVAWQVTLHKGPSIPSDSLISLSDGHLALERAGAATAAQGSKMKKSSGQARDTPDENTFLAAAITIHSASPRACDPATRATR